MSRWDISYIQCNVWFPSYYFQSCSLGLCWFYLDDYGQNNMIASRIGIKWGNLVSYSHLCTATMKFQILLRSCKFSPVENYAHHSVDVLWSRKFSSLNSRVVYQWTVNGRVYAVSCRFVFFSVFVLLSSFLSFFYYYRSPCGNVTACIHLFITQLIVFMGGSFNG